VLQHSEARVLFVGKLDNWAGNSRHPGRRDLHPLPLAPKTAFEAWDFIVARTTPLPGRPARASAWRCSIPGLDRSAQRRDADLHTTRLAGHRRPWCGTGRGVFVDHRALSICRWRMPRARLGRMPDLAPGHLSSPSRWLPSLTI
jgi:hypothetical protein